MKLILRFFAASCIATCALAASAQNAPAPETHGIAVASMDRSVKPGDDFYQYANGEWIKRTEIPPDRAEVDVFSNLADLSNKRTADLIEEIAKSTPPAGSGGLDLAISSIKSAVRLLLRSARFEKTSTSARSGGISVRLIHSPLAY